MDPIQLSVAGYLILHLCTFVDNGQPVAALPMIDARAISAAVAQNDKVFAPSADKDMSLLVKIVQDGCGTPKPGMVPSFGTNQ
jgi:hypothetical protein